MIFYRQGGGGGDPITLDFGEVYEPYYTKEKPHKGIDYGCPAETPILAAADGWVLTIGYEPNGYGNYIIILHQDNTGTVYAHLHHAATFLNARVQKGDVIGYSGNTGNSTGPHLHFEAREQASKISTAFDPKMRMQTVIDNVPEPVQIPQPTVQPVIPSIPQNAQRIDGGLCQVVCEHANLRDSESFQVKGALYFGAKTVVSPDVVWYNNLPYHKIMDEYMLIAEYDGYGTEILKQITK